MREHSFTVVELAGYVGENDRKGGFASSAEAWRWAERKYPDAEERREVLHVDVRLDYADGERTYDHG